MLTITLMLLIIVYWLFIFEFISASMPIDDLRY